MKTLDDLVLEIRNAISSCKKSGLIIRGNAGSGKLTASHEALRTLGKLPKIIVPGDHEETYLGSKPNDWVSALNLYDGDTIHSYIVDFADDLIKYPSNVKDIMVMLNHKLIFPNLTLLMCEDLSKIPHDILDRCEVFEITPIQTYKPVL